jgi:hypothetical protein
MSLQDQRSPVIRSGKYIWWNGEADLLRSFQIDYQLEFDRLFDGKIRRLCPLQYLVDVIAERRNKSFMLTL